jgi:trigger factor
VRLEIPGETVRGEADKIAANLARKINIPGFRPGHVPKSVVKTKFRKELRDEVVHKLLPQALSDAIQQKDLRVVSEPALDELKFNDDESIAASFTVEVSPDFDLAPYTSLSLTRRVWTVKDEDVEDAVQALRERHAELVPVEDRPAQIGDLITANMTGRIAPAGEQGVEGRSAENQPNESAGEQADQPAPDGESVKEIQTREVEVELGAKGVFDEFNRALVGASIGDVRTMSVLYPDDYKNKEIAGRRVEWTAEVTAVRVKELPELDDEFAGTVDTAFGSLDDLRTSLRGTMEREAVERSDAELRNEAMKALGDRNRFEVPQSIVDRLAESRIAAFARSMHGQGRRFEDLGVEPEQLRALERVRAGEDVRGMYILQRIAEDQNIEATDEEMAQEVDRIAQASGKPVEAVKARLTKENGLDSIKEQIENRKALDFVIASADIRTANAEAEEVERDQTGDKGDEEGQAGGSEGR